MSPRSKASPSPEQPPLFDTTPGERYGVPTTFEEGPTMQIRDRLLGLALLHDATYTMGKIQSVESDIGYLEEEGRSYVARRIVARHPFAETPEDAAIAERERLERLYKSVERQVNLVGALGFGAIHRMNPRKKRNPLDGPEPSSTLWPQFKELFDISGDEGEAARASYRHTMEDLAITIRESQGGIVEGDTRDKKRSEIRKYLKGLASKAHVTGIDKAPRV
ncbi:MAG TPA: hypothetical protein VL989_03420 [Candidatus Sulfotelmatobacter sp.]|nr:hypothetical protein [Candidatus Sulfotelmatobacter sp.]